MIHDNHSFFFARGYDGKSQTHVEKICSASHAHFWSQNGLKKIWSASGAAFLVAKRVNKNFAAPPAQIFGRKRRLEKFCSASRVHFWSQTRPEKNCSASRAHFWSQNASRKNLQRLPRAFLVTTVLKSRNYVSYGNFWVAQVRARPKSSKTRILGHFLGHFWGMIKIKPAPRHLKRAKN